MLSYGPVLTGVSLTIIALASGVSDGPHWPGPVWQDAAPEALNLRAERLAEARDYALRGDGSGCIIYQGRRVMQWGDQERTYDLKSTTKSFGTAALGLALKDGKVDGLGQKAMGLHPSLCVPPVENKRTGWIDKITLLHLLTQTAGIDKPGGYHAMLFEPGTKWAYSDAGPNWLAECLTLAYGRDLNGLLFERVFTPIGITPEDLHWRENAYRDREIEGVMRREFGSGIHANVDAMARFGYLYLNRGRWRDEQILPADFVDMVGKVPPEVKGLPVVRPEGYFNASDHYGLLWWNNADGTMKDVPRDAYWAWGLYDSLIVVIPSLDIVAVRAGKSLNSARNSAYSAIEPFIGPIATAVASRSTSAPYPASEVVSDVQWAPADTIVRLAEGSDNWPLTWGDDDVLYTAYGDGWGFEPRVERKLSLGLCKVLGMPPDIHGVNLRSESGERLGQGAAGAKASGMLMVDGILYMLVRNTNNSTLAWSQDRGKTWTWADWRFTDGFGCPTFLNFGMDYSGARDDYLYIYSHDSDSAYGPADRMVLARVRRDQVRYHAAYEFYAGLDAAGGPWWKQDIAERQAVFAHAGRCYRSGITFHPVLRRYLWCQIIPGEDTRFEGGFGIYEAPEPWGPWRTVHFTEKWDVGPGETCSIPTKWLDADGTGGWLVFSGDDCFSVRRFTWTLRHR